MDKFTHTVYTPGYVHIGPERFAFWVKVVTEVQEHLAALQDDLRGTNAPYGTNLGAARGHINAMCGILGGALKEAAERDATKEDAEPAF